MRIIRATHLGMCFGVRDAIALALEHADAGPLTILGDLVHNPTVLSALEAKGIAVAQHVEHVTTPTLMVTAHGTSERTLARTRALGLKVVEATCPLVQVAHRAVTALAREGYHVVIIGQRDHVEVRGLTGDLDDFDVVLDEEGVQALEEHPRIGIAAQTTQSIEKVRHLVASIRRRFPRSDVRFIDTVCKPTKERQEAAVELARASDVVIVVGGKTSNNTRELVKTCGRYCSRVHHVQTDADSEPEWFRDAHTVGITAGTSTPDEIIDRVEAQIRRSRRSCACLPAVAASEASVCEGWPPLGANAVGDRRGLCDCDGLGRSRKRVLHPRARRSDRAVPGQPAADQRALGIVELWREAATLVMIATLGVLAGSTWRRRAGYAALAFGAWDIFYYVFLRIMSGWPRTLLDWDILFLLPLPWWGPVLAPVSIALLMILWGTLATQSDDDATRGAMDVGAWLGGYRAGAGRLHDRRLAGAAAWP